MNSVAGTVGRGGRHAVVVGGSLAGLLAAHVLAAHADRVTVVERDRLPQGTGPRPGVPQGRHPHVLLHGGQSAVESLLPGFLAELRAAGAPRVGMPSDMVLWQNGRWLRRLPATTHIYTGSRAQLEELVRRRVLANPVISVVEGTDAVGLLGDAARVRGVLLRERSAGAGAEPRPLAADLVVDASGSGTKAPQWLAAIDADTPPEETIDTGLAYASRVYRGKAGVLDGETLGYYVYPNPEQVHAGGALPLEDGSHLVIVSGLRGDEPPAGDDEFERYTKRLGHPLLDRWLDDAEPLSPAFGYRRTANVRRRYDLPGRRPAGFLATGDALCTFNPIYGQGMAVAAMSAVALRDALAARRTPTTRRVQQALLAASRQAWDISAGADRKMPGAVGTAVDSGPADRVADWYLGRVTERSPGDPVVGRAFRSVLTLAAPVSALFAPPVMRAVLFSRPGPTPAEPPATPERPGD
ncbi:FAD-dependent monooxygenase [Streptomyces sp. S.PB5]|uniref:FAD-dependent monooxygenase n=1 Tax=Streptomyces sp. S.PB5 TaxID=3020844 RepID=UPI0025B1491D|nr:FAD-dependent monooxygenase [Streptomyces sp. S.PB5]MDN3025922.1 FAD-dependent monooxygenase [Streptomyces sp. S.PB5]